MGESAAPFSFLHCPIPAGRRKPIPPGGQEMDSDCLLQLVLAWGAEACWRWWTLLTSIAESSHSELFCFLLVSCQFGSVHAPSLGYVSTRREGLFPVRRHIVAVGSPGAIPSINSNAAGEVAREAWLSHVEHKPA